MLRDDLQQAWTDRVPCVVTAPWMSELGREIMQKYTRSSNGRFILDGALVEIADSTPVRNDSIRFKLRIIHMQ